MINNFLAQQIKENFPYQPTDEQENAVNSLSNFLFSQEKDTIFLLRGFAGTGKTSLIGALVKVMDKLEQKSVLLAPTGRAAKVFSQYADHLAYTIHKKIYRQRAFTGEMTDFAINDNLHSHTLFIVDEASMISNSGISGQSFGSGHLLDDLIQYVYSGTGCRLLIIGDMAQLPPIGELDSPALNLSVLQSYGLEVSHIELTRVVRQLDKSGILWNATNLRKLIFEEKTFLPPHFKVKGFPDVKVMPGNELIEALTECYDKAGMEETIVICRSNKRANIYNNGIRNRILWREDELSSGDMVLIAKNNYHWTEGDKTIDFIANGDIAEIKRVRRTRELYGFRFVDALLSFPDYNDFELEATVLIDTLQSDSPALTREQNERLFYTVMEDYTDVHSKQDKMKKMKVDSYYNALQIKFAYAITGHKAQGGQWKNVFLDQGYITEESLTADYYRWLYTAVTRATETLYLINFPSSQID